MLAILWFDKIPEKNQRRKQFKLAYSITDFSPWLASSVDVRPVAREKQHRKGADWREASHLTADRKEEMGKRQ